MKILITGCGRSGTGYAAKALTVLGFDIRHEQEGAHGTADWMKAHTPQGYDLVLHQVRHPLKAIASCYSCSRLSWILIARGEPRITLDPQFGPIDLNAMKYWLYWNEKAEQAATYTYQVENFWSVLGPISKRLGVEFSEEQVKAALAIPKTTNTRLDKAGYKPLLPGNLTWDNLKATDAVLAEAIRKQAKRYGYEVPEK